MRVKVGGFNGRGLFIQSIGFQVGWGRGKLRPLVRVLGLDVTTDGTRFVEDESIIVLLVWDWSVRTEIGLGVTETRNIRDLAKWLLLQVGRALMFSLGEIDIYEFIGDLFLMENNGDTTSAGGFNKSVQFENHRRREKMKKSRKVRI